MKKKHIKKFRKMYMKVPWTYQFIPCEVGYFVQIKELPGCMSQGENLQEAYDMIRDAMKGWLTVALEDDMVIPMPDLVNFGW